MRVAEVKIGLLAEAGDTERKTVADCAAAVFETVLKLPSRSASYRFEVLPRDRAVAVSVEVFLFPLGSAHMRRAACEALIREISDRMYIEPEAVCVRIIAPPQERVL